tara:strand:- start:74 stop:475 length:402 start_codon:yes stop_codon:yes gene_type:complete
MRQEVRTEIIIYDGVCVLCNFFIRLILNKDKDEHFSVTSLQSNFTKTNYPDVLKVDSVAVIKKDGAILQKSKAVFYILRKVKMLFIIRILILILPTFMSNIFYDIVAFTRYKFFGKYESCPVINGDLKSRIIE